MLKHLSILLAAGCTVGMAQAGPVQPEDWEKFPALAGLNLSWEGDVLVGMVHEPGTNGMKQAAASWDLSGDIDISKPLVPSYVTPGNRRMRMVQTEATKAGKIIVVGSQTWTGRSAGCIEGVTTGNNKTYVQQAYMTDKKLVFKERDKAFAKTDAIGRGEADPCDTLRATGAGVESVLPLEESKIVISRFERGEQKYYIHDLKNGREEIIYRAQGEFQQTLMDQRTGAVLAETGVEAISGTTDFEFQTRLLNPETGQLELEEPLTARATDRFTANTVGRDDATGKYIVLTDKFRDHVAAYFYDAKTNQFDADPIFAHPEFSVEGVVLGNTPDKFNQILGFQYGAATRETYWLDPEMKAITDGLTQALGSKGQVRLRDWSKNMDKILFTVGDSRNPNVWYLLIDKSKVAVIGSERPWIEPESLGKSELIYYDARDGLKIPALLHYPANWKEGDAPAPLIVSPHGGPWVRDYLGMDFAFVVPWTSKGYFVLQPQYRGSQGFGRELWLAGDNNWGLKMQDDKDDGAQWLVDKGWVDPNQMAMMGYSYGGFAAMAAAVRPDSPYQCSIAGAGVSNLAKLGNRWSNNRVQRAFQGRTVDGMDPAANVEKANIPILVIHGDRDVRVPLWQGKDFYNSIKSYTDATYYEQKDAPHGFPWPEHRKEWIEQIDNYLATTCNMPPPIKG